MSEAADKKPEDAKPSAPPAAAEAPVAAAATPAAPAPEEKPTTALDAAAKSMDAAPAPDAAPANAPAKEEPALTSPAAGAAPNAPNPALSPSAAANTSGMHLQYVAPGVHRQSLLQSNKWQLVIFGAMMVFCCLYMFRGGGIGGDLGVPSGNSGSGNAGGGGSDPRPPMDNGAMQAAMAQVQNQAAADSTYQPLQNRMPAADLTVNAGAIGDTAPAGSKFDAGMNKGGYNDERAALDAAEAMIAKDPEKALAMVDQHDKDYPRGILDPDARIVRIEAFQKKGDDAKALALGNEFLEDYPHSPRAGRVQAIVEAIKNKGAPPGH